MRILALDVGHKRIGIAISDPAGNIALPLETLVRSGCLDEALRQLAAIARDRQAQRIVVGLPTSLSGQPGPAAQQMAEFAEALDQVASAEVVLWDERFTTVIAEKTMIAAEAKRRQRRQHIDKVAATLILQNYLDAHSDDYGSQEHPSP